MDQLHLLLSTPIMGTSNYITVGEDMHEGRTISALVYTSVIHI